MIDDPGYGVISVNVDNLSTFARDQLMAEEHTDFVNCSEVHAILRRENDRAYMSSRSKAFI